MSTKHMNKLKILPVNKSVVFYSPIEGDDVLVRTGTIAEGSCFFHTLLHAFSTEYVLMNRKSRMKFVHRLRGSLAGKVDRDSWEDMGGGVIAKVPFQENLHTLLENFYNFLDNDDDDPRGRSTRRLIKYLIKNSDNNMEIFKLICELITLEDFKQIILPVAYEKTTDDKIMICQKRIVEESLKFLTTKEELKNVDQEKVDYIKNMTIIFLCTILKEAESASYKKYISGLENVGEKVDSYTIDFISKRFNRDIYFIDGKTRLPYNNCSTPETLTQRKSVIVLLLPKNHYEIVGRLLPGNKIQREFSATDPLIKKLRTFILNPEEIKEKYPELSTYIPRNLQNNESPTRRNIQDDQSNSENEDENEPDEQDKSDDEPENSDRESRQSDPYYDDSDSRSTDGSISN